MREVIEAGTMIIGATAAGDDAAAFEVDLKVCFADDDAVVDDDGVGFFNVDFSRSNDIVSKIPLKF
jgi:hypothetical protein